MSSQSRFVTYPFILPGNRRIKHIKGIFFRSLSRGDKNKRYNYFYTLHKQCQNDDHTPSFSFEDEPFYKSEICYDSINPIWKNINTERDIPHEILKSHVFLLCLYRITEDGEEKCCDRKIDLRDLVHLPIPLVPTKNSDGNEHFLNIKSPNTHIIQLTDGYYVTATVANELRAINTFPAQVLPARYEPGDYNIEEFVHSLSIYKTAIEDIHKQEEEKAKELETFTQMKKEHEQENLEVLEHTRIVKEYKEKDSEYNSADILYHSQKASVDYLEDENNDRIKSILALLDKITTWETQLETSKQSIQSLTNEAHTTKSLLEARKLKCFAILYSLYKITYDEESKDYKIKGIPLPDTLDVSYEVYINCSLGYISHLILLLAKYCNVELPYSLFYVPSQSYITKYTSNTVVEYPLYLSSSNKAKVEEGISLLKDDLKVIFESQDFSFDPSKNILKSLYEFFSFFLYLNH